MSWIVQNLWLLPALPLLAAGLSALAPRSCRKFAASLAIGSMIGAFLLSLGALAVTLGDHGGTARQVFNFPWLQFGDQWLKLGWVLDPLTAVMLVMVTFVGTLIFIFSVGYMAHDENFTRFFCFLALFAAAMLGLVIANNLLLLFMCWEVVGLASYLLIGFWFHKPSAAAAAKKAFITTRIGDVGFFLGILWLYSETGTLLFYDDGNGCLEANALSALVAKATLGGMAVSTAISLLIFCGAVGKSGQVPLHVWLPDAMEGPTPVSALIHAATMVAAGVFLVARVFPLMDADVANVAGRSTALTVIVWIGSITAVFAALIATAQTDIKRILAYSTVSQLGYMMLGLGVGGVAVGMFHLITHAFFKALLFLGSGSVIHGCHEEQDIRRMGGLRKFMPVTFATYAIGMMALAGVPLVFSGFWSKDEILHKAMSWEISRIPLLLALVGAFLTAFYMTRQMIFVFFGKYRGTGSAHNAPPHEASHGAPSIARHDARATAQAEQCSALQGNTPHESPAVMTLPLIVLAACAILLGLLGTPAWPWFESYLNGHHAEFDFSRLLQGGTLATMALSSLIVAAGIFTGWKLYGQPSAVEHEPEPLERLQPAAFRWFQGKFFIDELYQATVIRLNRALAVLFDWFDRFVWDGLVQTVSYLALACSWISRGFDEWVVNLGFDGGCKSVRESSNAAARLQNGRVQNYLRWLGLSFVVAVILLIGGCS